MYQSGIGGKGGQLLNYWFVNGERPEIDQTASVRSASAHVKNSFTLHLFSSKRDTSHSILVLCQSFDCGGLEPFNSASREAKTCGRRQRSTDPTEESASVEHITVLKRNVVQPDQRLPLLSPVSLEE